MQELLVKIPPTQSRKLRIERFFNTEVHKPKATPKRQVSRTCFTHHFVIEESTGPISINLSNIPKGVMPLEMAQEEIQKSYDKGFEDGQISETAVARAEIKKFTERMRTMEGVIQDFEGKIDVLLENLQLSVISISKKVSSHIMRSEMQTNFDAVNKRLSKIIESVNDQKIISVHINPSTLNELEDSDFKLLGIDSKKVEIIADETIAIGDCVIETDYGFLEAKVEDELDKMMAQLLKKVQSSKTKKQEELLKNIEQSNQGEDA